MNSSNSIYVTSLFGGFITFSHIVVISDIYTLNLKNTAKSEVDYKLRLFLK